MANLLSTNKIQDVVVVHFSFNEIGLEEREQLKRELSSLLSVEERKFILDLSKVGFLSSLVIASIVFFAKEIRNDNGELKICGLSNEAQSVFQITHLDRIFDLYKTEHDAIESFKTAG